MTRQRRVIIAQQMPRFESTQASVHGDVTYLFDRDEVISDLAGQSTFDQIYRRLKDVDFDPLHDHVALTGRVAIVAMLVLAASVFSDTGSVNTLVFDARDGGTYRCRRLVPA